MISIDPYAGQIYNLKAGLILVSHGHPDQNAADRIQNRSEACRLISNTAAFVNGEQRTFDLGDPKVEAVQAWEQAESRHPYLCRLADHPVRGHLHLCLGEPSKWIGGPNQQSGIFIRPFCL